MTATGWGRSSGDIVSEIKMAVTNTRAPVLVVEGDSDECFFARRVVDGTHIIDANGRINVEGSIALANNDPELSMMPIIGVVDEDYDWYLGIEGLPSNIVKFDPRDLEGLLIRSSALDAVLVEYSDRSMARQFSEMSGSDIRTALAKRAEIFGRIRIYNSKNRKVCLKALLPRRFKNSHDWSYSSDAIIAEAVRLGVHDDVQVLSDEVSGIPLPSLWHAARGHDLIDILVDGLKSVLGGGRHNPSEKKISAILRQSIPSAELDQSILRQNILQWERSTGHRLFA